MLLSIIIYTFCSRCIILSVILLLICSPLYIVILLVVVTTVTTTPLTLTITAAITSTVTLSTVGFLLLLAPWCGAQKCHWTIHIAVDGSRPPL